MAIAKLFYQSILWKGLYFLSAFILNIFIARHYEASLSGEIFYLINLYSFIILIGSASLESSIGYYISKNELLINKILNFCFVWTALIAIAVFLFIIVKKK